MIRKPWFSSEWSRDSVVYDLIRKTYLVILQLGFFSQHRKVECKRAMKNVPKNAL